MSEPPAFDRASGFDRASDARAEPVAAHRPTAQGNGAQGNGTRGNGTRGNGAGPVEQFAALAATPPVALGDPHLLTLTTRALVEFERLRIERDTWMLIAEERELALQRAHDALDAVDGILAPAMDRPARRSSTAERRPVGRSELDRRRDRAKWAGPTWAGPKWAGPTSSPKSAGPTSSPKSAGPTWAGPAQRDVM